MTITLSTQDTGRSVTVTREITAVVLCANCHQPIEQRITFGGMVWEHTENGRFVWCDMSTDDDAIAIPGGKQ